jgi:8-oxo-dGTP pyrophosphatase MutT (NUDIX family)
MTENHFTATGIVFNSKQEILMIYHNKLKVWLPPGGHIEENELPDDAVLREIFEETGVKAEIISSKRRLSLTSKHCKELEIFEIMQDVNDIAQIGENKGIYYLVATTHWGTEEDHDGYEYIFKVKVE